MKNKDVYINGRRVIKWIRKHGRNIPIVEKVKREPTTLVSSTENTGKGKMAAVNVTGRFLKKHKENKGRGKVSAEPDIDWRDKKDELHTAFWLAQNFGIDVVILKEENKYKVHDPDYYFCGTRKFVDLKSVSSERSVDKQVRKGIDQIEQHGSPGGLIIDEINSQLSHTEIKKAIIKRLQTDAVHTSGYVIMKKGDILTEVFKYQRLRK